MLQPIPHRQGISFLFVINQHNHVIIINKPKTAYIIKSNRFDGVPVLFLPGNSGSHMQARSLASVALRKALSKGYQYHFDFFSSKSGHLFFIQK